MKQKTTMLHGRVTSFYMGKWKVGIVRQAIGVKGKEPPWYSSCLLPGMDTTVSFDSESDAIAALEHTIKLWFNDDVKQDINGSSKKSI